MTLDPRADRTALRLKLYQNGFTPLANKNKMTLIKEWSTLEVTPELIQSRQWARSQAFLDTGLRCGDIIALDWDIDDKDLLNALLDAVIAEGVVSESPFVRIGKAPRELWVYRTADKIGKRTTGHFLPPGSPEDFSGYAVEVLGAGCQFAAFGQRDENTAYAWPADSPLDHVYMDLPEISLAEVERLKNFAIAFFETHGLTRASAAGGTDGGYTHVYDLTPELVFEIKDQGAMTVAEIAEALAANPEETWRCTVDSLRPTSGSWAGMVSLVNGVVCISDHGTYTSHFPLEADSGKIMQLLGRLLAERFPAPAAPEPEDLNLDPLKPLDDNLAKALRRYVYVESDAVVCDPQRQFMLNTVRQFKDNMKNYVEVRLGARGGEQKAYLADLWQEHPGRLTVQDAQMRPDRAGELIFVNDTALHVNTYAPPIFPPGGDARIGLQLIDSLLPNPAEHRFFTQWLAHKYRHPAIPGPAVVMVARGAFGTGRGTVIKLMEALFGDKYVKRIDFNALTGKGSQSQYNDWMSEALVVAIDEASENEGSTTRWQARNNAYEHLKTIVDPNPRTVHIKRKSVKNTTEKTFASFFIASNHSDALVIPANDRRFAVLENGAPAPTAFWDAVYVWLAAPANIGAFARHLMTVDLEGYNPFTAPPMTAAKADMIEAGASDLDKAAALVLAAPVGAVMVKEQFVLLVETTMLEQNFDFPEDWQRIAERIFTRKSRRVLGPDRHLVAGKMRSVRLVGSCEPGVLQNLTSMISEIEKNGPLVRPIATSGKVVSFAGARSSL